MKTIFSSFLVLVGFILSTGFTSKESVRPEQSVVRQLTIPQMVQEICPAYGVPAEVGLAVASRESNFNADAVAYEPGAKALALKVKKQTDTKEPLSSLMSSHGVMQVMGFNAALHGVPIAQLYDPRENIELGCAIIGNHLREFKSEKPRQRTYLALWKYNGKSKKGQTYAREVLADIEQGIVKKLWAENA